jgi:hypothetical protein
MKETIAKIVGLLGEDLLQCHFVHHKSHMNRARAGPGNSGENSAKNRPSLRDLI